MTNKTNSLSYNLTTLDKGGNPMYIKIRLNDECKNGHQDFAITADIYQRGKPKTDRNFIMGGCCHDEILAVHPELKIFVDLHLCDYKGVPMHAVANGYYHLHAGFSNTQPYDKNFISEYCEYYRITKEQFDALKACKSQVQFAIALKELGILKQWEVQANEAIAKLEALTECAFIVDSKKSQYVEPTQEELKEEAERQANGYYTPEAELKRQEEKAQAMRQKIIDEGNKKIQEIKDEYAIKLQIFDIGGKEALDNSIFYAHTKQIKFNWKERYGSISGDRISDEVINKIKEKIVLPEGVTFHP